MTPLPEPLPALHNPDSSMWIDESIWGHRLHDEQSPWLVFLEFCNVLVHEDAKGRAFQEPEGCNKLFYEIPKRLHLRNILFNTPFLAEINERFSAETGKWSEFLTRMQDAPGLPHPEFAYLRNRFHSFEDFCETVSLLRSTGIELSSNKRWTIKFVFPYGKEALYQDLNNKTLANDRLFFARTGEMIVRRLRLRHQSLRCLKWFMPRFHELPRL